MYTLFAVSNPKHTVLKGENKVGVNGNLGPGLKATDRRVTVVEALRRQLAAERAGRFAPADTHKPRRVSTGLPSLDRLLPGGGLPERGLVECLGEPGSGVGSTALLLARRLVGGGICVVLDSIPGERKPKKPTREGAFFKPGIWGPEFDGDSLVLVRPRSRKDLFWAFDQALRTSGVTAIGWFDEIPDHTYRRFLLATEEHGTCGVLVRPSVMKARPAWADIRLAIEPIVEEEGESDRRAIGIRLLHCRESCTGHRRAEVTLTYGMRTVPVSAGTVAEVPFVSSLTAGNVG
ncbi:MAG: hypothetical protein D6741_02750 [Planctomycetota bacterium]|nr:MAG: hypothetical protein D6741_02750 [Planctomycetota bacterium]